MSVGVGPAGSHLRERGVTRRVQERDRAVLVHHLVGADVLGDATCFTIDDVGAADVIEQRGLAVVDVTHHGDHRRTGLLALVVVGVVEQLLELDLLLLTGLDQEDLRAHLEREQLHLFVGKGHRGRDHLAVVEQEPDHVGRCAVQLGRELLRRHTTLDDDDTGGDRRIRRRIGRELGLQFVLVATTTPTTGTARRTPLTTGTIATTAGTTGATGSTAAGTTGATGTAAGTTCTATGTSGGTWGVATGARATRASTAGAGRTPSGRSCGAGRRRNRTTTRRQRTARGRRNRTTGRRQGAFGCRRVGPLVDACPHLGSVRRLLRRATAGGRTGARDHTRPGIVAGGVDHCRGRCSSLDGLGRSRFDRCRFGDRRDDRICDRSHFDRRGDRLRCRLGFHLDGNDRWSDIGGDR